MSNDDFEQLVKVQGNISDADDPYTSAELSLPEEAHAGMLKFESGLVFAEVHGADHDFFPYQGIIGELNGFKLAVYPVVKQIQTPIGMRMSPGCITEGVRSLSLGDVTADLHYRMMKPIGLPAKLALMRLDVRTRHPFPVDFTLTAYPEKSASSSSYGITLRGSPVYFVFSPEGELSEARSFVGENETKTVPDDDRPAAYNFAFNCGNKIPTIDVTATILHSLRPFTGHSMPYSGRPEQQSLDSPAGWLVTRQP